ncbi:MAG: hypothetical protein JXB29_02620, partial [Sedimentisphaerales bacterium]|nr:hypothetical protein [Sedimentisphaerales bacterium]
YLNIIYETAYDIDKLSEIYLGTSITFLWYMVKPLVVFLFTMAIVQLPFIITLAILDRKGITYEELWIGQTNLHLLLRILFMTGLFIFPMAILTTAVSKDIMLLRPDYLIKPILKALVPYLVVAALVIATGIAEMQTANYFFSPDISLVQNINRLGLNLAVQLIAIIAMRSIGLFYRHYACYCAW